MSSLPYILEVQLCIACLWIFYRLALERDRTPTRNRIYLLSMCAVAATIPAVTLPLLPAPAPLAPPATQMVTALDPALLNMMVTEPSPISTPAPTHLNIMPLLLHIIWSCGSALLLGLYAAGIWRMWRLRRHATLVTHNGEHIRLIETQRYGPAFSFMGDIYLCRTDATEPRAAQLIAHERAHVDRHHSWDLGLSTLLRAAFWWNPFVWLWARSLSDVHEFQADRDVLQRGYDPKPYIRLILQQFSIAQSQLSSGFCYSRIKKRFTMMTRPHPTRRAQWKLALGLPLAALLLGCFSLKARTPRSDLSLDAVSTAEMAEVNRVANTEQLFELIRSAETSTTPRPDNLDVQPKETLSASRAQAPTSLAQSLAKALSDSRNPFINTTTSDTTASRTNQPKPLIYVDEVEVPNIQGLDARDIKSVSVFKDSSARAIFGKKGRNGVICITTHKGARSDQSEPFSAISSTSHSATSKAAGRAAIKSSTTPKSNAPSMQSIHLHSTSAPALAHALAGKLSGLPSSNSDSPVRFGELPDDHPMPLLYVDGVEVPNIQGLDARDIKSVSAFKDSSALAIFGEKGRNGVICITTKNARKSTPKKSGSIVMETPQSSVTPSPNAPMMLVDGVEVKSIHAVKSEDIAHISFIHSNDPKVKTLFGNRGTNGVVMIFTHSVLPSNKKTLTPEQIQSATDRMVKKWAKTHTNSAL